MVVEDIDNTIKSIGIIGGGVVGKATARTYMEGYDVRIWDIIQERSTHTLAEVLTSDIVFICLPTPRAYDGNGINTSHIEALFSQCLVSRLDYQDVCFVLRSTVPVGTTNHIRVKYNLTNLVYSPEFLTSRCAIADAMTPARNIIGGSDCLCMRRLIDLYHTRFTGTTTYCTFSQESEYVKLMQNAFFAVKIAFFNEANNLALDMQLDWHQIMTMLLADGRINPSHTKVPGPDGMYGFGGDCLTKDLSQFIQESRRGSQVRDDMFAVVCQVALNRNEKVDRKRSI